MCIKASSYLSLWTVIFFRYSGWTVYQARPKYKVLIFYFYPKNNDGEKYISPIECKICTSNPKPVPTDNNEQWQYFLMLILWTKIPDADEMKVKTYSKLHKQEYIKNIGADHAHPLCHCRAALVLAGQLAGSHLAYWLAASGSSLWLCKQKVITALRFRERF